VVAKKILGSYRYNFHFIKNNCDVLEAEVIDTINTFQILGYIVAG